MTMRSILTPAPAAAAIAISIVTACAHGDRPGGPDLRGSCWVVELDGASEITNLALMLPPLVLLDSAAPDTGVPDYHRLSEVPGSLPSVHRHAMWKVLSSDSVELVWSTGFSGWLLRMNMVGDTMTGLAEEIDDGGSEPEYRSATAVRIDCDTPVPLLLRQRLAGAPEIPLSGGASLRVGAVLEPHWPPRVHTGTTSAVVTVPAAGAFAGADSVVIHTDRSGRIVDIALTFPDAQHAAGIVDHLAAIHGPPAETMPVPGGQVPGREGATWIDREVWIMVSMAHDGRRLHLRMADPRWAH